MTEYFPEDDGLPPIIWDDLTPPDEEEYYSTPDIAPRPLTSRHVEFMSDPSCRHIPLRTGFLAIAHTDERILPPVPKDMVDPTPTMVDGGTLYFSQLLKSFALEADISMQDRADIFTANWLMRTGQESVAYTLLCGIKDPDARRVVLHQASTYLRKEISDYQTADNIGTADESDTSLSLFRAFVASEQESATDEGLAGAINAIATSEEWGDLPLIDRVKTIGLVAAGRYFLNEETYNFVQSCLSDLRSEGIDEGLAHYHQAWLAIAHIEETYMAGWENTLLPSLAGMPKLLGSLICEHGGYLRTQNYREEVFRHIFELDPEDAARILLVIEPPDYAFAMMRLPSKDQGYVDRVISAASRLEGRAKITRNY